MSVVVLLIELRLKRGFVVALLISILWELILNMPGTSRKENVEHQQEKNSCHKCMCVSLLLEYRLSALKMLK